MGLVGGVPLLYSDIQGIGVTYLAMIAIGVAAAGQILAFALTRDHFPRQDLGIAIAIINMAVVMGGMIFQPLVGVILHHLALLNHPLQLHHYRLEEYQWALLALPLCYVLGLVMSVFCIRDNACVVDKTRK